MRKRGRGKGTYLTCVAEIVLLLSLSITTSLILSSSTVSAIVATDSPVPSATPTPSSTGGIRVTPASEIFPPGGADAPAPEGGKGLGIGGLISSILTGSTKTFGVYGPLVAGLAWGGIVAGGVQLIGGFFGADENTLNALSAAAFVGSAAGGGAATLVTAFGKGASVANGITTPGTLWGLSPSAVGVISGVGIAAVVFVLMYKEEKQQVVSLQCLPWEAPLGGADCEQCNGDPLKPCSEYRCKSLGQACELVNTGTAEERCVWVSRNDVNSPTIQPWAESLFPENQGLRFIPDATIRPPNRGVTIVSSTANGCIAPFTPLEFGIQLNEPAQCKIDTERPNGTAAFDSMQFYFGDSNFYRYNHTQTMRLPSPDALSEAADAAGLQLENDGTYNYYVRCRDANGNENVDDFVINFCVDPSPDTTPPIIESTSVISGSPVQFGLQELSLTVNVNEPSQCKWSLQDKDYGDMEHTMQCSSQVYQQNSQQLYPCSATLTGIEDRASNLYYFRCQDQPLKDESERNTNTQSYLFELKGSQALTILRVGPNETVTGSTDTVLVNLTVETSNGAQEGKAVCYFSPSGSEGTFVAMFESDSFKHEQLLSLSAGSYNYYFRCIDLGGNAAESSTSFTVFTDRAAPLVTRIYREGPDALKLVTNEDAACVYSTTSCNYNSDEGVDFIYTNPTDKTNHFTRWEQSKTYYIKCQDEYGNQPAPNACSIIANAASIG